MGVRKRTKSSGSTEIALVMTDYLYYFEKLLIFPLYLRECSYALHSAIFNHSFNMACVLNN